MELTITLTVNGEKKTVVTEGRRTLLEVLREDLGLTGTKYGCGEGQCGACTVLMDGRRVLSCVTPVSAADKKSVVTIEGLAAPGGALHPVQEAFLAEDASQCGYCAPGMMLTTVAFLEKNPDPSEEEIVKALDGNLCRCCGHPKIVKAVRRAAKLVSEVKVP